MGAQCASTFSAAPNGGGNVFVTGCPVSVLKSLQSPISLTNTRKGNNKDSVNKPIIPHRALEAKDYKKKETQWCAWRRTLVLVALISVLQHTGSTSEPVPASPLLPVERQPPPFLTEFRAAPGHLTNSVCVVVAVVGLLVLTGRILCETVHNSHGLNNIIKGRLEKQAEIGNTGKGPIFNKKKLKENNPM